MTIKLPDLVPFNDPVTVCAACRHACCLVSPNNSKRRCAERSSGKVTATSALDLAEVQMAGLESQSYWKGAPGHDIDMPLDVGALHDMTRYMRKTYSEEPDGRGMALGYLVGYLGIDPEQVAEAMAAEWPEVQS